MRISRERLQAEAETTGFRMEILEKVIHLLHLLDTLRAHPFLRGRWALKGGTALNLFLFDVPRLSVDIDLNYVGSLGREQMAAERPKIEQALRAVFAREGFSVIRAPAEHAGGRWALRYQSALGQGGNLEVDLNYLFRMPLWEPSVTDSRPVASFQASSIPLLDIHELAAGKLAALLARNASRDLYDAHQMLTRFPLERERLRIAFVVYGAINRRDWRTVSADDVKATPAEVRAQRMPTLRRGALAGTEHLEAWVERLVAECREGLSAVLPLRDAERAFLDRLLDQGEVDPLLLTRDEALAERIRRHPALEWKALNVRQFKTRRR
ncbi:MAG: nucleotidyl transferase AbiEii/AbiGii toxin family protein [Bryobacteraceae bacterium]|nr:nucleotidyl transferase AbiEii/AbiGii toxin family protein [Bryobacteraceae bacterium]